MKQSCVQQTKKTKIRLCIKIGPFLGHKACFERDKPSIRPSGLF